MSRSLGVLFGVVVLVHAATGPLGAGVNEWTTAGPSGGSAMAFALAPSAPATLYVWDRSRLWRSDDRGESWRVVPSELDHPEISWFEVDPRDPERLYTNIPFEGFSFSNDGGATWRPFSFNGTEIYDLVIDPSDPDRLWAASPFRRDDGVSVWRSTDGGQSWGAASRGLRGSGVGTFDLAIAAGSPATLWATGFGVWRSVDGGASWQPRDDGLPDGDLFDVVTVDPTDSETLYVGADLGGLWKTTDGGTSWELTGLPLHLFPEDVVIDPDDPATVYVLSTHEVLRSRDGGDTWTVLTPAFSWANRLVMDPNRPQVLYAAFNGDPEAGHFGGVLRTRDGGDHWRTVGIPTDVYDVRLVPGAPGTLYAANSDGLFRSTDGGRSWSTDLAVVGELTSVVVDPTDPDVLYVASPPIDSPEPRSVWRSTNGGDTWTLLDLDVVTSRLEVDPAGIVYALGEEVRLFKTLDGGDTWIELDSGGRVGRLVIDPANPDVLYGTVHGGGVSKSDDGGFTWRDVSNGLPAEGGFTVAIAADAVYAATGGGTYRSDNGGASWQLVSPELAGEVRELLTDPSGVLYAGTFQEGVWRSVDGGASWRQLGLGRDAGFVYRLAMDPARPETLYAGTDAGVHVLTREPCVPGATTLCVDDRPGDRRFRIRMSFATEEGGGRAGDAVVTPLAPLGLEDGGVLAFFSPTNPEVLVKVLDGCAFNGHFWVFAAAATSVGTELVVEDTLGAKKKTWVNSDGAPAPTLTDNGAFASCGERPPRARRAKGTTAPPVVAVDVGGGCLPDATTLCLGDGRFRVRLAFDTVQGGGRSGDAAAIPLSPLGLADGGVMAFFSASNPEVLVKVLDGCEINGRYWVFAAAATNVGFELVVDDLLAGTTRVYRNPDVHPAETITDVDAFATCGF